MGEMLSRFFQRAIEFIQLNRPFHYQLFGLRLLLLVRAITEPAVLVPQLPPSSVKAVALFETSTQTELEILIDVFAQTPHCMLRDREVQIEEQCI